MTTTRTSQWARRIDQPTRDAPANLKGENCESEIDSHNPEGHCVGDHCHRSGPEDRQEEVMQNITEAATRADTP